MKHQIKKRISIALASAMVLSAACVLPTAATETNTVRVVVKNSTFAAADGAAWEGQLIDTEIALNEDDSVESVLERAVSNEGYEVIVSEYGYIASVNGLAEYAANGNGGWMAALNDWFTADGTSAYTVANGGLKAGDELVLMFTCSWGSDVGSLYGNYDTSLQALNAGGADLLQDFSSSDTEYTLLIEDDAADVTVVPEAYNKNYQVRMYKNEYHPESTAQLPYKKAFPVNSGDVIYIGVGNPAWPSMNSWGGTAEETVYTLAVKRTVKGNLDGNGTADIQDVTFLQRCLAEFDALSQTQKKLADIDGSGDININDATAIQRIISEQ